MKLIYDQTEVVKKFLPKQSVDNSLKYREIFYIIKCAVEKGFLILNTVTYELIFLNTEEIKVLKCPNMNNSLEQYLAEHYFLVSQEFDDKKFANQVINTRLQIQNIYTNPKINTFVILPTTGCNARCFYCFEQGTKVSNMTEQTAHDVAKFIKKKGAGKVWLQWFGGEPLVNSKVIDIICADLISNNIEYNSRMVSNGYLMDDKVLRKAVDLWRLKKIQITLDGTEDIYNRVKNYVYKDVSSPFVRVLNNIENILKAGIQTSIRLNMDVHNNNDLFELSKLLVERFNKFENCYIYVVRLFEDTCSEIRDRSVADRHKLIENSIKLQNYIDSNMPEFMIDYIPKAFDSPNTCIACSDKSVMIVPDGHLGKCEHYVDSDFFGSIYSDDIDFNKIAKYKERKTVGPQCEECEMKSLCLHLKCCSGVPNHCDEVDKNFMMIRLHSKLRNIYNKFKETEVLTDKL